MRLSAACRQPQLMSHRLLLELKSWARFYLPGSRWLAPYHRTPEAAQKRILAMAGLDSSSRLLDLGSGSGDLLARAAAQYRCSCIGYELDRELMEEAQARVALLGLQERCTFVHADFMTAAVHVAWASHIFMYLSDVGNATLVCGLQGSIQPGTKLLSVGFPIKGRQPALQSSSSGLPMFMYEC